LFFLPVVHELLRMVCYAVMMLLKSDSEKIVQRCGIGHRHYTNVTEFKFWHRKTTTWSKNIEQTLARVRYFERV